MILQKMIQNMLMIKNHVKLLKRLENRKLRQKKRECKYIFILFRAHDNLEVLLEWKKNIKCLPFESDSKKYENLIILELLSLKKY